jgi:hypothetical protein
MLYRLEGNPSFASYMEFSDVAEDAYYGAAVYWAVSAGITNGTSETTFSPDDILNRQQLAVMLNRYVDYLQINTVLTMEYLIFADEADIADWAGNSVQMMVKLKIFSPEPSPEDGSRKFEPLLEMNRADTAVVLQRFIEWKDAQLQ